MHCSDFRQCLILALSVLAVAFLFSNCNRTAPESKAGKAKIETTLKKAREAEEKPQPSEPENATENEVAGTNISQVSPPENEPSGPAPARVNTPSPASPASGGKAEEKKTAPPPVRVQPAGGGEEQGAKANPAPPGEEQPANETEEGTDEPVGPNTAAVPAEEPPATASPSGENDGEDSPSDSGDTGRADEGEETPNTGEVAPEPPAPPIPPETATTEDEAPAGPQEEEPAINEPEPQPPLPPTGLTALPDIHPMSCSDPGASFDVLILAAAKNFEKQKIAYNSIPLSDCSGMFHRLAMAVGDFCPDYRYPEPNEARDTRDLARWYFDNSNLVIVQDAAAGGRLIRPGSVMFFGNSDVKYTNITIDKIAVRGGIEHMGTVVEVEKDEEGNVIGYSMFHGRNPRKPAGITKHKKVSRSLSRGPLPSFGNWTQQWVAVANIATQ